jgi:hypothetical protein
MDLYGLLGGLSFASLLGATIIFLARRNSKKIQYIMHVAAVASKHPDQNPNKKQ